MSVADRRVKRLPREVREKQILDAAVDDKGGVEFLLVPQPGAGRENGAAPTP